MRIGLISDTHALLRPEALDVLAGCQHIIHCGDIGGPEILEQLGAVAPVTAVRGNNDLGDWAQALPEKIQLRFEGVDVYVIHDLKQLDIDPASEGVRVVVSGHSHKSAQDERGGVLYVNPGSAGRRRFRLPMTLGELVVEQGKVLSRIVTL